MQFWLYKKLLFLYTKLGYIPYEIEKYINNNQQTALIKLKKIWKC